MSFKKKRVKKIYGKRLKRLRNKVVKDLNCFKNISPAALKAKLAAILCIDPNTCTIDYLMVTYYDKFISKNKTLPIEVCADKNKFYDTRSWKDVRELVFKVFGKQCLCCGATENIEVDHVVPRSIKPELALLVKNLQPLCKSCNMKKGTRIIDYRVVPEDLEENISI